MALPFINVTLYIKMFTMLNQTGNTIGLIYLFNWLQQYPDVGFVSVRQWIMSCGGLRLHTVLLVLPLRAGPLAAHLNKKYQPVCSSICCVCCSLPMYKQMWLQVVLQRLPKLLPSSDSEDQWRTLLRRTWHAHRCTHARRQPGTPWLDRGPINVIFWGTIRIMASDWSPYNGAQTCVGLYSNCQPG
jgi:hypothetical protein